MTDDGRRHARTVIVTDANHAISLPFIRSLGRLGWRVVAGSHRRDSPGLASRYASARFIYPSPGQSPDRFVEVVAGMARRLDAGLVIPLSEATVVALDGGRESLPAGSRLALPDRPALEVALDKARTVDLAREHGVPVPDTRLVHTVPEAVEQALHMQPPFALKPVSTRRRISGESRLGTLYASDARAVERQARRLLPDADGVLLQRYVAGTGVGVNMLLRDGRPLLAFQHRRIRELPVSGGPSALRESVPLDRVLYGDATKLVGALRWNGLAMVEFRVGERGHHLMEINGRAWGSLPLAVQAGVDFPAGLVRLYCPDDAAAEWPPLPTPYAAGVRSRNLQLDLLWAASVLTRRPRNEVGRWPRRGEALRALAQLLDPAIAFDVLSRDDPRPGAVEILHIARYFAERAVGR